MTAPTYFTAPGSVTGQGMVLADVACRKCAYNLRSLGVNARCPECGTPVGLSVQGDLLRYAEPAWLEKLRRGIHIIFAGLVIDLAGGIVAVMINVATGRQDQVASNVVGLVGGIVSAVGIWLLTEPDPSGSGEDQYGRVRLIVRAAVIIGLSQNVLQICLSTMRLPPQLELAFGLLAVVGMVFQIVAYVAQLSYLERLVRRIPDPRLAGQFHFLMYAYGVCYTILAVIGAAVIWFLGVGVFAGRAPATMPGMGSGGAFVGVLVGVGCAAGITGLAVLVFFIIYLVRLGQLSGRLREQAAAARYIWSAAAGAPPLPGGAAAPALAPGAGPVVLPAPPPEPIPAPAPVPPADAPTQVFERR
jgi:hypothetical protein